MPVTFGRGGGPAKVVVDHERCTLCRQCLVVCNGEPLIEKDGRIDQDPNCMLGCTGCGQCMAVCPVGCIEVVGRDFSPADVFPIPPAAGRAGYEQLSALMSARRSVRVFKDEEIPSDVVQKIIDAASTAPMGLPPSEVSVLVRQGRDRVRPLRDEIFAEMAKSVWVFSAPILWLMRPIYGKEGTRMMKDFMLPAMKLFLERAKDGEDLMMYDAPLALYFYASEVADPADPIVAATYAMLAAESLGVGSCMLGFPGQILCRSKTLKAKYGMPKRMQPGIMVVFGYGKPHYLKAVKRRFAKVSD